MTLRPLSPPRRRAFRRMVAAQAAMEARLMLRNGEQLLLAVVIPVIVLVGGVNGAHHVGFHFDHPAVDVLTPGVLALAVMSTSFTSLAIATGFERRYGVIKRLGSSPLPRSGLLAGKVGGLLVVEVLQIAVIAVVALLLGWDPAAGAPAAVLAIAARDRRLRLARPGPGRGPARGGHPRRGQPGLPAAAGRWRRRPAHPVVRRRSATSPGCCRPGPWATRCGRPASTGASPGATCWSWWSGPRRDPGHGKDVPWE